MTAQIPNNVAQFLGSATPADWALAAAADLPLLLNDHANCEKKAAATALSLMFRYAGNSALCDRMSRLAREELRHYEQVARLMQRRGIVHQVLPASRYARRLREAARTQEPGRLTDTLIIGALIEARSCERFALLIPLLDEELGRFYAGLLASEARHFEHYLALARETGDADFALRRKTLGELESTLATSDDDVLRFHSGPPRESRVISPGGAIAEA